MAKSMDEQIALALGADVPDFVAVAETGAAELRSCFAVTDLAVATIRAAMVELAGLTGAREVSIDRHLASLWFDMTLRPDGWAVPSVWDPIAGDYSTADGWIRLHTNAPHHRDAALEVLGGSATKADVATRVAQWCKSELETAIVTAGGAAAAMHSCDDWADHPQGQAVASDPLILWQDGAGEAEPIALDQLKVLDLTRVLAGPVATRFLAGFGAQVLRIDPPWWNEPGVEPEVTLGKSRTGLDLTQARDRDVFESLLGQADVLVHGYRPGALEALGYGSEDRRRIAPGQIDVSLCAYGWHGPWAARRGFDSLVQMSCGIAAEGMARAGAERPVPLPVQALDHATGYLMAAAVLRALRLRRSGGRVMSARLSLARTAALLVSQGTREFEGAPLSAGPGDMNPKPEHTDWGPARRVRFPALADGAGPGWAFPAGKLRTAPPVWPDARQA